MTSEKVLKFVFGTAFFHILRASVSLEITFTGRCICVLFLLYYTQQLNYKSRFGEREREKSKGRRQKGVTRDFFIVLGIKARKRLRGGEAGGVGFSRIV